MNLLGLMGKIKVDCLMNQIKGLESDRYKPEETKKRAKWESLEGFADLAN